MTHIKQAISTCLALGVLLAALLACKSEPDAPIKITAQQLYAEYQADRSAADAKYKGKTVIVTGKVGKVKKSELSFVDANGTVTVNALSFAPDQAAALAKLKSGEQATVQGTCDGRPSMMGTHIAQVSLKDSKIP